HTRSDRDWSSDVCSSDLVARLHVPLDDLGFLQALAEVGQVEDAHYWYSITLRAAATMRAVSGMYFSSSRNIGVTTSKAVTRSTEIGRASCRKECRSRGWA